MNKEVEIRPKQEWEPFCSEPTAGQKFVNLYGGPFAQQLELNRTNAERLIVVAAISGQIILSDIPMDRKRYLDGVNPDGSVTVRRQLFFGQKIDQEKSDKKQSLVTAIPQGWKIEIPGQEILETLARQKSNRPLNERFTGKVNERLRVSLNEIILREKLTSKNNAELRLRIFASILPPLYTLGFDILIGINKAIANLRKDLIVIFIAYGVFNSVLPSLEEDYTKRSIGSWYEHFMPPVEIDRVIRGLAFVNGKGRNLVRLKQT